MTIDAYLAGATEWASWEVACGIAAAEDLCLVAAVSRTHAGRALGDLLGEPRLAGPVYGTAAEALAHSCDVSVEYTKPDTATANVLAALRRGAHVAVGTSGLTEADYAEIDSEARVRGRGVLAVGNFPLTVVPLHKGRGDGGAAHPAVGNHRLRARRQAGGAERDDARAGDPAGRVALF